MRRRRRSLPHIVLNAATAVSLVLCVATLVLWVRSYRVDEHVWLSRVRGVNYSGILRSGSIVVSRSALTGRTTDVFSDDFDRGPGWSVRSDPAPRPAASPFTAEGSPRLVQWIGFDSLARVTSRPGFGTLRFRRIVVPMWLPALTTALPLIPLARRLRRETRRRGGLCIRCGYDLRATPERCPECGLEPTAKSLSIMSRALEHYGHKSDPGGHQDRKIPTTVTNGPPAATIIQDGRDR